ncbi:MAG: CoA-binding protein [Desulfobacterales bacterium]|nr:CoA-binding protein [Desulfobacterales bacterium]
MVKGRILVFEDDIKATLETAKTIAVLGLSPKPQRDSHKVGLYLKQHGYTIIPVRPAQAEVLGEKAYPTLQDIPVPVDIVDAFINPARILPLAEDAVKIKPKLFWMQLGVENAAAAEILINAGIDVIMNRCIKIDHAKLIA